MTGGDGDERAAIEAVTGFGACGPLNGGFRIRVSELAPELARHGIALEVRPLLSAREDEQFHGAALTRKLAAATRARCRLMASLRTRRPAGTVLIHRQADLFPDQLAERAIASNRRLLYDVDDAVWLHPSARGRPLVSARKLRWLAARADCVLAGNDRLAETLGRYSNNVHVVPSLVDPRAVPAREHADRDPLVVGWIGSPDNAGYLEPMLAALEQAAAALAPRRVELEIVGGDARPVNGVRVRPRAWSADAERSALQRIDVGVMPLPENAWTRSKCGYKALLYQSAGIPVVADDVGVARQVVREGGFVVRGQRAWTDALVALLEDATLRGDVGAAGRRHVEAGYSVATWAPRIAKLITAG